MDKLKKRIRARPAGIQIGGLMDYGVGAMGNCAGK